MTLEEARDHTIVGCVVNMVPGMSYAFWEGAVNVAKFLELALNNGRDPLTGAEVGLRTGEIESFHSFGDLYEAILAQLYHFLPILRKASRVAWSLTRNYPVVFSSVVTKDCIKRGKDLSDGGGRWSLASGYAFVGVVDLANSLAAIRKLVFEERKFTLKELKEALAADFEGYEEIHSMCLDAPKLGW